MMKRHNDNGRREALVKKAAELLDECRIRRAPVNLVQIARHVGIQHIRELDVRLDGQLFELDDGSYEVILSSQAPYTRRRFTLAHEIGHILVAGNGEDVVCGDGPIEELCNAVAAELLLPAQLLSEWLSRKIDVSAIRQIASQFQCSLEATSWRILNAGAVEGALLIWRDAGQGRFEVAAAPRSYGFRTPFQIGDVVERTSPLMEKVLARDSGPIAFIEPISGRTYVGDYVRLNKTVLTFLQAMACTADKSAGDSAQGELF